MDQLEEDKQHREEKIKILRDKNKILEDDLQSEEDHYQKNVEESNYDNLSNYMKKELDSDNIYKNKLWGFIL